MRTTLKLKTLPLSLFMKYQQKISITNRNHLHLLKELSKTRQTITTLPLTYNIPTTSSHGILDQQILNHNYRDEAQIAYIYWIIRVLAAKYNLQQIPNK